MSEENNESKIETTSMDDLTSEKISAEDTAQSNSKIANDAKINANEKTTAETTAKADVVTKVKETAQAAEGTKAAEETKAAAQAAAKAIAAAKAAEEAEKAAKEATAKAEAAKAAAEAAAEEEYKAIAAEVKSTTGKTSTFTNQRKGEEIFRREMEEPEFFLAKKDRFPRPILSSEEQDELTRKVEIPTDNTPKYIPQHVLSPEFGGMSNYESGVGNFLEETKQKLKKLKNDPNASQKDIITTQQELAYLESIYENYYIGMNVFRTAKGGRDKLGA
jgi:colicin import membrane protein